MYRIRLPIPMEQDELDTHVDGTRVLFADEAARGGQPTIGPCEPPGPGSAVTDSDLAALRAKFPFLKEFSDSFIKANKPNCLMRMETANMKLREAERTKDKLAHNRMNIHLGGHGSGRQARQRSSIRILL